MNLTEKERRELTLILEDYLVDPQVLKMKTFIQHGNVTTYEHCGNVTRVSMWLNRRLHIGADEEALIVGAFLHDFYLYDWHGRSLRYANHGFTHPAKACENAVKHFQVGEKEQNIIRSHMWPMTLLHAPVCREAAIVCVADKYCSLMETLLQRKHGEPICK